MKTICLIFFLLLVIIQSNAQVLVRFYENGKAGYKDKIGNVVVPVTYDAGSEFSEGMALVLKHHLRGYIDNKGDEVIPFIYSDAS